MSEDKKAEAVEVLFDVIRAMLRLEIGDSPSMPEEKEAIYIAKYIQGIIANAIGYWRDYRRLPLLKWEVYGDHRGTCLVDAYMSPDAQMVYQFMLRELVYKLKDATDKWDLELQARHIPVPDLDMGKVEAMIEQYSGIVAHINKDKKEKTNE